MKSAITRMLQGSRRPLVMGILNITPDSFSDGGQLFDGQRLKLDAVLQRARTLVEEGADILDVGGESTRPGARLVPVEEELDRVTPVVEALVSEFDVPVSVDTSNAPVITAAAEAGAGMINDVRALTRPGALEASVAAGLPVCLMHMQNEPGTMQQQPEYGDVVGEVEDYLLARVRDCIAAGIAGERLILDPGFGFGKTLAHNLALFRALPRLASHGYPLLVGVSRKTMIGEILGKPVEQRVFGSITLAAFAAGRGAAILRVHDVGATVDALKIQQAVEEERD